LTYDDTTREEEEDDDDDDDDRRGNGVFLKYEDWGPVGVYMHCIYF
jgi:hypothetical protein